MDTWHKRLAVALAHRGKEWKDLFAHLNDKTGIKMPSVYAWKPGATKRSTMMDADNAAIVCEWLGVNALWLFHNTGPSGLEEDQSDEHRIASIYRKLTPTRKAAAEQAMLAFLALDSAEQAARSARLSDDHRKTLEQRA